MSSLEHFPSQGERGLPFYEREIAHDRFLAIVQESADVFWILTPSGEMQEVCSAWQTFTGQRERDCLGRGWQDAVHPTDRPQVEEMLLQSVTSRHTTALTCHIRRYDGSYRLLRARAIPVRTTERVLREIVVCGTDVTQQELAKQMSEAQVQLALKAAHVGLWERDLVADQLVCTDQEKALFGLSSETTINYDRFLSSLYPDDRERVDQLYARGLAEKQEYSNDYRTIWPDGSIHWLSDRAQSIYDAHGKPVQIVGATVDITDLKQAEKQLQEAKDQVTTILESISDSFWHIDKGWRFTYMNQKAEELTGRSREKVLGQCLWDVVPDLLGTPFEHYYRAAMAMQQTMHFEALHPTYQRWVDVHVYPTQNGLSVYFSDINERKQAEEALRESEARFRRFMESNIIGMAMSDLEGNLHEANDAFLSLIGYTREDLAAGRVQWTTITSPEAQAKDAQAIEETLRTGVAQPYEKEYVTKDGKRVPVLIGRALFRREGSTSLLLCFVLDLTVRKELERQKDLFLGMTGHELKTPLASLRGTLQLVQRRLKRALPTADHLSPEMSTFLDGLQKSVADSVRQIDVQTRLINDLLDVSRITSKTLRLSLHQCDLVSIVRETVEDLRVTAPERSLLLELPEHTTINVLADRDRISQVVTNYVTNALRYSSPNQPVSIGLDIQEDVAHVWVRDQGLGLTQEAQKDAWQRFHQVKGVPVQKGSGKGLGLGLYICQTLIEQHQGEVGVESTPGEGSTFWFTLPLAT